MVIGLLIFIFPIALYLATFIISRRLKSSLCWLYRIVGGIIVILGSSISFYFAAYSGEQGGVTAFYLQIVVISVFLLFSVTLVILNWALKHKAEV